MTKATNDLRLYTQYAQDMLYDNPQYAGKGGGDVNAYTGFKVIADQTTAFNKYLTTDLQFGATGVANTMKDSWGNAYKMTVTKDATKTGVTVNAYSFGPNATDDSMGGDDIYTTITLNDAGEVSVTTNFAK